ncbi:MAG TPA: MCP four helix bundle domain-containing protein, partial [Pseudoduganella sp.]
MQWFRDLKIARKLLLAFAVVQLLMLVLGIAGLQSMSRINDASSDLAENWMPSVRAVMQVRSDVSGLRRQELAYLLADDAQEKARIAQQMETALAGQASDVATYEKLISSPEERAQFNSFRDTLQAFVAEHGKLMEHGRQGRGDDARAIANGPAALLLRDLNTRLDGLVRLNVAGGEKASAAATQLYETTRAWTIALLVGAVTIGIALALWVAGIVSKPLREAVD